MASEEQPQVIGKVNSQDLTVSWISEQGTGTENTDRVCILVMANGQIRLTMQSATLNMKGMRLTKGHICVFAVFSGDASITDKASETFMNNIMRYDITKKPAKDVLTKCLAIVDKELKKDKKDAEYKASIAAFAAKELTGCCVNGGRLFVLQNNGKMINFTSENVGILAAGLAWKNVLMVSDGYPIDDNEIKDDMRTPVNETAEKRGLKELPDPSSLIRVQRL